MHDGGPLIKHKNSSCDKINNLPVPKVKKRNSLNPYCASKMHQVIAYFNSEKVQVIQFGKKYFP